MSLIDIPKDKFFFGRFDCFHAGVGYLDINIRIHSYIDPIDPSATKGRKKKKKKKLSATTWREKNKVYFCGGGIESIDYDKLFEVRRQNGRNGAKTKQAKKIRRLRGLLAYQN